MGNLLSILITTYNRAEFLNEILGILFEYQKRGLGFDVIVSDDCSTDNTQEIAEKWLPSLKDYKYIKSKSNMGMDGNFISAYTACETDYCWLLGDHRYVEFDELKRILDILESRRFDALVLNCHPKNILPRKEYTEINSLLLELGHNVTNNASCIIPSKYVTEWAYKRYYGTTFLHMGIFVENLCYANFFKVLYVDDVKVKDIILPVSFTESGWYGHPFLNFGKLWFEFVMSLPNLISIENKSKILLSHNRVTGIFDIREVLENKHRFGDEYVNSYIENRQYVPFVTDVPRWCYDVGILILPSVVYRISIFPKRILNMLKYRLGVWRELFQ